MKPPCSSGVVRAIFAPEEGDEAEAKIKYLKLHCINPIPQSAA